MDSLKEFVLFLQGKVLKDYANNNTIKSTPIIEKNLHKKYNKQKRKGEIKGGETKENKWNYINCISNNNYSFINFSGSNNYDANRRKWTTNENNNSKRRI